jgi:uncharacterized protein with WD repeat
MILYSELYTIILYGCKAGITIYIGWSELFKIQYVWLLWVNLSTYLCVEKMTDSESQSQKERKMFID